jgi:ABC-2 type transport system ATP-binding protein
MTPAISVAGLTRRYRGETALDNVTFDLPAGAITGLLGRNGAGKTTLLRIIAGQDFATSGQVRVLGASPAGSDAVLRRMVLIREDQAYPDFRVRHALRAASWCYPNWSASLAGELMEDFALPPGRKIKNLSRGMRSALGIVIGLAARAEVTLFDEPYAGLDATARQVFYHRLLASYAADPRTIVLSTHLIDEAAPLLERVVVMDRGRAVLDAAADDLRGLAVSVSGPALAVADFTAGRPAWAQRRAAGQATVVMLGPVAEADAARARGLRLSLEPLTLQQVVVHAAARPVAAARPDGPVMERTSA